MRRTFKLLPGMPRCMNCDAPLAGLGAPIARSIGVLPSSYSPKMCNQCEIVVRQHEGGAQVDLTMLFADVRGSVSGAADKSPQDYTAWIQRFYKAASGVLIQREALVNRLMGDQVIGLFVPRLAGPNHAAQAVRAGVEILQETGHADLNGSWIPVGVGVHRGRAFVGAVGSAAGVNEIAVLGEAANLGARLASAAGQGEVVISEEVWHSMDRWEDPIKRRTEQLKGVADPVLVGVITVSPPVEQTQ